MSVLHPPGQVILKQPFKWDQTDENRYAFANISTTTKILYALRMGTSLTILSWQQKRFNCRLASFNSNAEGSVRLLCDSCGKFQVLNANPDPHITQQGCGMCISKVGLVDVSLMVRLIILIDETRINLLKIQFLRDHMPVSDYWLAK